jgi:hypothetical protein
MTTITRPPTEAEIAEWKQIRKQDTTGHRFHDMAHPTEEQYPIVQCVHCSRKFNLLTSDDYMATLIGVCL